MHHRGIYNIAVVSASIWCILIVAAASSQGLTFLEMLLRAHCCSCRRYIVPRPSCSPMGRNFRWLSWFLLPAPDPGREGLLWGRFCPSCALPPEAQWLGNWPNNGLHPSSIYPNSPLPKERQPGPMQVKWDEDVQWHHPQGWHLNGIILSLSLRKEASPKYPLTTCSAVCLGCWQCPKK